MKDCCRLQRILSLFVITVLLGWISFVAATVQIKYRLGFHIFLGAAFLLLLIRRRASIFNLRDWPLWFFILAMAVNIFFTKNRDIAIKTYFDLSVPLFLVYYFGKDAVLTLKTRRIAAIICIFSFPVALLGLFEVLFRFNPIYKYFIADHYYAGYINLLVPRPMSTQFNPAVLGSYLVAALPFYFLFFREGKRLINFLVSAAIAVSITILILTFSRSALLAFSGIIMFYLLIQKRYGAIFTMAILILALIVICSLLPYPFDKFSIGSLVGENGFLSPYRTDRYIMACRMFTQYPLTGIGFYEFRARFLEYYPGKDHVIFDKMIADNMYLTILAETGIISFLGLCWFIFNLFKAASQRLKIISGNQERAELLAVMAGFIGLLLTTAGYELFFWPAPFLFLGILAGMLAGLSFSKS